jgi:hypothetical protein
MGLEIIVGPVAYKIENIPAELRKRIPGPDSTLEAIKDINKVLKANGLKKHVDPEKLKNKNNRSLMNAFNYSDIHYLRRANSYLHRGIPSKFIPFDGDDPAEDPKIVNFSELSSHLNTHSDSDGYYVPQDFPDVIVYDSECFLGSSQSLMAELCNLAPLLEINLSEDGILSDEEAKKINDIVKAGEHPLCIEVSVWFALYEAARLSIENNALIAFV